eukprot:CAMPEP_0117525560 /NCGR_PEP_ID=MMETSP0784-20121206/35832_1 /TAXON_ID=39447 /ORGANISM="" /LENGTH=225 /DNA_ID=CAMNT_0005321759 /DNA_START=81 /DNA_END=759 /DNA_ORIENTATION=-
MSARTSKKAASSASGSGSKTFATDLSKLGTSGSSRIFTGGVGGGGVLDEERRVIEKVFGIVDKDNSGFIDTNELQEMFKLFGVDSPLLTNTISRIMQNVDRNNDSRISADDFYALLSQKFEKGDPRREIDSVFRKMDRKSDGKLDLDELSEVATQLGDDVSKPEIKEMIKLFNVDYQKEMKAHAAKGKKYEGPAPEEPTSLSMNDFYEIMQHELVPSQNAEARNG